MRWLPVIVVSALAIVAQTSVVPLLAIGGARPDVILVVVIFWAWHLPFPPAVAVGLGIGVAAGCLSAEPMGLFAVVYFAAALAAFRLREFLFLRHLVTQVVVTAVIAVLTAALLSAYVAWRYPGAGHWTFITRQVFAAAAYTALCAPLIHRPLLRASRLLGIAGARYPYSR
ncbi:MAG: rod shape-determining protein MreD [Phycisphaerales bacterium]|nr:MAG: rod shape-determining protein MreD [Phycisphaerales bacterium]